MFVGQGRRQGGLTACGVCKDYGGMKMNLRQWKTVYVYVQRTEDGVVVVMCEKVVVGDGEEEEDAERKEGRLFNASRQTGS
jgi:hypothetical protein